MEFKKIVAILMSGEVSENINEIEINNDNEIIIDGETWLVLSDSEADDYFQEYEEQLIEDCSLNCFSCQAKDYVMENCVEKDWFEDCMKESYEFYIEDLRQEGLLEDEMEDREVKDEKEFLNSLCNQWADGIEWYFENFGEEEFLRVVEENRLYDVDKVIAYIKEHDGRGCIASWDGEEIELEHNYYAYRID